LQLTAMKRIVVFGSTGSIGKNVLEIARSFPSRFKVAGLTTNARVDVLYRQIRLHNPDFVCVKNIAAGLALKAKLGNRRKVRVFLGEEGLIEAAGRKGPDMAVMAISGSAALAPLLQAIESGKDIALANKEALVVAGSIVTRRCKEKKIRLIPIDSEQSAIWQCLEGRHRQELQNIYLTASGGPFYRTRSSALAHVSRAQVLAHPRWKMGEKITVDSATLMNKGLEVLEAMWLFGVQPSRIKTVIHPQAIIHSMVEFIDGVIMAQLSVTDMRIPIQYALSYPRRLASKLPCLDFYALKSLDFFKPDFKKFPCLGLAYRVAEQGGTAPAVMNAANEAGVEAFLNNSMRFVKIPQVIERVLSQHRHLENPGLNDILEAQEWARQKALSLINRIGS